MRPSVIANFEDGPHPLVFTVSPVPTVPVLVRVMNRIWARSHTAS